MTIDTGSVLPEDTSPIKTIPDLYWGALAALILAWLLLGSYFSDWTFNLAGEEFNVGYLLWVLGTLHFVAGFDVIKRNEIAGVFVLGIPTIQVSGMFVCAPIWIFQQEEVPGMTFELRWPEDPKKVYYGHEDQIPEGFEMPIRIPFADPSDSEKSDDPLNRRSTNDVSLFVRIRVERFFDFYARIWRRKNARGQIESMSISLINKELTKMTLAQALRSLENVDEQLLAHIRENTKGWGIHVSTAQVKLIGISYSLNKALEVAAEGAANARGIAAKAEGEKTRLRLEGEGAASAIQAALDARARGLKNMATTLHVPSSAILAAETARSIGQSDSDKIIIGAEGFANLVGIGAAIAATLPGTKKQTEGEK